jgi:hypothetical protein
VMEQRSAVLSSDSSEFGLPGLQDLINQVFVKSNGHQMICARMDKWG